MRAIVLSGGPTHDFATTSGCLAEVLDEVGLDVEVYDDIEAGVAALGRDRVGGDGPAATRLLVVNLLRWTMRVPARYADRAAELGYSPSEQVRAGVRAHLDRGGGLLGMHTASICFDDWPEWGAILGGAWNWDRSHHPPAGPMSVRVSRPDHPLVSGLDGFSLHDECYGFLDLQPDVAGLIESEHSGTAHPLLWAREYRGGRVVYDALGHDESAYQVPEHREIVRRAARWAARLEPARRSPR
ncbi:MAG: ThuA domain-containing protein [Pseudonocardiaceae bacterium]|nr:ThuA domain-containing protein [Pseudonocardiaceae bacterium]